MDFALTETQTMLKGIVADFLGREMSSNRLRVAATDAQLDRPLWESMASQGWLGLGIDQSEGGLLEQSLICGRVGYAAAPIPYVSTLATLTALQAAGAGQDLVGPIVRGERVVPFVDGRGAVTARRDGDVTRLTGRLSRVSFGEVADDIAVLTTGPAGLAAIYVVPMNAPEVSRHSRSSMGYDAASSVVLKEVKVSFDSPIDPVSVERGNLHRSLCAASEAAGAAERALELAVEYAKTRSQFGRPIGAFQRVQHDCAEMALSLDGMRFALQEAVWSFDRDPQSAFERAAIALAFSHKALLQVTAGSHEVFGGVGFFVEHELHYYTRRIAMDLVWMGRPAVHLDAVAVALGI